MNPMASSFYLAIHATVPHMYFHPRKIKPSNPKNRGRFPRSFFLLQLKGSKFRGSQNRIFFSGVQWEKPRKNPHGKPSLHGLLPRNFSHGTWKCMGFQSRNLQTSRDFGLQVNHVKFQGCTVRKARRICDLPCGAQWFPSSLSRPLPAWCFWASGRCEVTGPWLVGSESFPGKSGLVFFWWCKYRVGSWGSWIFSTSKTSLYCGGSRFTEIFVALAVQNLSFKWSFHNNQQCQGFQGTMFVDSRWDFQQILICKTYIHI